MLDSWFRDIRNPETLIYVHAVKVILNCLQHLKQHIQCIIQLHFGYKDTAVTRTVFPGPKGVLISDVHCISYTMQTRLA